MTRVLLCFVSVVLMCATAWSGDYIRLGADSIMIGTQNYDLVFYVERTCPDPVKIPGASNGFTLTTTGAATWTFVDDLDNTTRDGFYADPTANAWWNLGGMLFTDAPVGYLSGSGMTSGRFMVGGAGFMAGGMPVISEQEYFSIRLTLGDGAGQICIDSAFIPPAGAWKFSGLTCGGIVVEGDSIRYSRPSFLAKDSSDTGQPICITIYSLYRPVLAPIGPKQVIEQHNLNFVVSATDEDGTIPVLTAEDVPTNATFTDNGDGTGVFDFNPEVGQADTHYVRFIASDGLFADTEVVEIEVAPFIDADDDFAVDGPRLPTALHQNYPNPFNPSTSIDFHLAEPASADLEVYNVLGQRVRLIKLGRIGIGGHNVVWDGTSDNGEEVPSGLYFYRLTAGSFVESRKMVLLR